MDFLLQYSVHSQYLEELNQVHVICVYHFVLNLDVQCIQERLGILATVSIASVFFSHKDSFAIQLDVVPLSTVTIVTVYLVDWACRVCLARPPCFWGLTEALSTHCLHKVS